MKKLFLTSAAVLTLGAGAYSVYANNEEIIVGESSEATNEFRLGRRGRFYEETRDLTEAEREEWFEEMHRERLAEQEERIQRELDAGRITEEEAAAWREDLAAEPNDDEENGSYRRHRNNGDGHHDYGQGFNRNSRRRTGYCH